MSAERAVKVAIVGGGCAAITTAFELSRPELQGRYHITVYQMGWRLGGKGASGRGPSGRIEEHGLHIWLGFYENAFRLLRECYAELAADPAGFDIGDWRDAFITENYIGLSARSADDLWHNWSACFPPKHGLPGDSLSSSDLLSARMYVARAVELLRTLLESVDSRRRDSSPGRWVDSEASPFDAASVAGDPQRLVAAIGDLVGGAFAATGAVLIEALAVLQAGLKMLPSPLSNPLTDLTLWIAHNLRQWLERNLIAEPYFQHVWEIMDLVVASVVGIVRGGLLSDPRGFDAIDDYDWRQWLLLNGASERSIQSAFVGGLYDLVMSYEDGDGARPRLSAGAALRGTLRMFFTYRGALYWRMRAGMGDVIFAPFYEVLRRRGVKFEFFHRLTNVRLSAEADLAHGGSPYVEALEFDVQAGVRDGAAYSPLVRVNGRPCWPARPDFTQLEDGERMARESRDFESHWERRRAGTKTLDVVKDFDFVVLGVSLGAIPYVCREIVARDPRWGRMVAEVKTVPTQAFQIWLNQDLEDLGWSGPHLGSALTKPFNAWCDMAHTIPEEGWSKPPKTVVYFCAAMAEPPAPLSEDDITYVERCREVVRGNALGYLRETARLLWPGAYDAEGTFRWEMLSGGASEDPDPPANLAGVEAFATQYWRANVNPSDRYVLAVPGSAKYRISPLDVTYDNLTIAGDWTACGLNQGCVEAAVMSGRLAAHALAGVPLLEEIVGYDHP
jgi:uncharacterized protein with NAD-binding domain and iron-sulfur cluster